MANKIVFMDKGVVAAQGTPEEVFKNTENKRLAAFLKNFNNY